MEWTRKRDNGATCLDEVLNLLRAIAGSQKNEVFEKSTISNIYSNIQESSIRRPLKLLQASQRSSVKMLRNIFLVSVLIYAVCAVHWEIREVDSAEDQLEETEPFEKDDSMVEQQILDKCKICKLIMKIVKKKIPSNDTPDDIKNKLNSTCEKAKALKRRCKRFVEKYLQDLIDELMTNDGPNTICVKVHACKPEPPIKEFIVVRDQAYDNL